LLSARRALAIDEETARRLNTWVRRRPAAQRVAQVLAAWLAPTEVLLMLGVALSGQFRTALRMLYAVGTVYVLVEVIGRMFWRERPFVQVEQVEELLSHQAGRSFPSRHVASGVAMAAVASCTSPRVARSMRSVAWLLGLSRVASGLHYPSDVFAGAALGEIVGRCWRSDRGA
jgi:membrane-associated phospholipid phosphatase